MLFYGSMTNLERRHVADRRSGVERRTPGGRGALPDRRNRPAQWETAREHVRNAIQLIDVLEPALSADQRENFDAAVRRLWHALQALERGSA